MWLLRPSDEANPLVRPGDPSPHMSVSMKPYTSHVIRISFRIMFQPYALDRLATTSQSTGQHKGFWFYTALLWKHLDHEMTVQDILGRMHLKVKTVWKHLNWVLQLVAELESEIPIAAILRNLEDTLYFVKQLFVWTNCISKPWEVGILSGRFWTLVNHGSLLVSVWTSGIFLENKCLCAIGVTRYRNTSLHLQTYRQKFPIISASSDDE